MTPEEAAFQAQLDADPYDQNARAAFADWLEDRGDPRAAAVRELWRMGWAPLVRERDGFSVGTHAVEMGTQRPDTSVISLGWWNRVKEVCRTANRPIVLDEWSDVQFAWWETRLACESAVIAAYQPTEVPA